MLQRTAKSCGPDAPTLASSLAEFKSAQPGLDKNISADDGGKRARSPGRARRKPLKPLRAGMPGDSGVLVVTRVRSTTIIAHEAAGALGIRHSPRPLWAEDLSTARAHGAARSRSRIWNWPFPSCPALCRASTSWLQERRGWPGRSPAMTKRENYLHVIRKRLSALYSKSGGPEAEHAVGIRGRQTPFDQHVIDMGDQLAGGKAHLMHIQHMLVEHDRHQFLGCFRGFPAGIGNQSAAFLVMVGQLLDACLQSVKRNAMAGQHQPVIGQGGGEARQRGQVFAERVLIRF